MILGVGFPNPVGWTVDKVTGFVSGTAAAGFEAVIGGLTAWIIDAVVWVVGGVFNFFLDSPSTTASGVTWESTRRRSWGWRLVMAGRR